MQPTLNPDSNMMTRDVILLNRYTALKASAGDTSAFKVGDVVVLTSPIDPRTVLIKRIIGLPGSIIRPIVNAKDPTPKESVRVPVGHCWIEGDEQFHTRDSNKFGPVPMGLLRGKVDAVIWPLSRLGPVPKSSAGWEKRAHHPRPKTDL